MQTIWKLWPSHHCIGQLDSRGLTEIWITVIGQQDKRIPKTQIPSFNNHTINQHKAKCIFIKAAYIYIIHKYHAGEYLISLNAYLPVYLLHPWSAWWEQWLVPHVFVWVATTGGAGSMGPCPLSAHPGISPDYDKVYQNVMQ